MIIFCQMYSYFWALEIINKIIQLSFGFSFNHLHADCNNITGNIVIIRYMWALS